MRISLEIDGKAQFDRTFHRMGRQLRDLSNIWPDMRDEVWRIEDEQFDSEGAAGQSGRWKPLSERYRARKAKKYGRRGILVRTGRLKRAMTGKTADTVYQTSPSEMVLGTNLRYALFHQRGSGKLPKREIYSFSDTQKRRLQKTIQKGLVRELRAGGVYVED